MPTDMTNAPSYARAAVASSAKQIPAQKTVGQLISDGLTIAGQGLTDTYSGYMNAQIAAANMANAASAKAQADQFKYNKELMDLQNQKQNEYFAKQLEFNAASAKEANAFTEKMFNMAKDFNAAEAQKNRDYQTEMSNTAWQRAVEDMKAAGINPILAAQQGGASTPGGSSASISSGSGASASAPSASAAGASVGNYSGQGYHISDSMAIMGGLLSAIGNIVSGYEATHGTTIPDTVGETVDNMLTDLSSAIDDTTKEFKEKQYAVEHGNVKDWKDVLFTTLFANKHKMYDNNYKAWNEWFKKKF